MVMMMMKITIFLHLFIDFFCAVLHFVVSDIHMQSGDDWTLGLAKPYQGAGLTPTRISLHR